METQSTQPAAQPSKRLRRIALCLLVPLQLSNAAHVGIFFQTDYTLSSPLIPAPIISVIAAPFLKAAIAGILFSIVPLVLLYKGKLKWTIATCSIGIAGQQVLPSLLD